MSRLRVQEALGERFEETQERLLAAYERFRESRLYVQTICMAVLVGLAGLVHLLPYGPVARANAALEWALTGDYDFTGKAEDLSDWARGRGGWRPAMAGLWEQGLGQVREWVGPVGPFAPARTAPPEPAVASPVEGTRAAVQETGLSAGTPADQSGAAPSVPLPPLQPVEGSVLSEYGWPPQGGGEEFHEGLDFLAKAGAPVVAVLDGTVVAIRPDQKLGTVVEVKHGDVIATYGQVEAVEVRAGDSVRRGQLLAAVARSRGIELAMPPHLHFEIRPVATGTPVNPAPYLGLGGKKL